MSGGLTMKKWSGPVPAVIRRGDDAGPFEPFEETDLSGRWLTFVSESTGRAYRSCCVEQSAEAIALSQDMLARQTAALFACAREKIVNLESRRAAAERLGFADIEQRLKAEIELEIARLQN